MSGTGMHSEMLDHKIARIPNKIQIISSFYIVLDPFQQVKPVHSKVQTQPSSNKSFWWILNMLQTVYSSVHFSLMFLNPEKQQKRPLSCNFL